ncbi:P-loop containing nucleoside triphosphate hydrolase protein, partial [Endogone sp. FLAS-F59071]
MPHPLCNCKKPKPAIHLETKKAGPNRGRWFYKCGSNECSFWKWDENTPQKASNDKTTHNAIEHATNASSSPINSINQRKLPWNASPNSKRPSGASDPANYVSFAVHSSTHLALKAPNSQKLDSILRSIPDCNWNEKDKVWLISLSVAAYTAATNHLSNTVDICIKIKPLPETVLHVLAQENGERTEDERKARRLRAEEMAKEKVRPELLDKLMPFQREGVIEVVARGGRVLLGDEMGLGKTIQSLALCSVYSEHWPVLVLCPSSLRLTWRGEITKWLGVHEDEIQVVFTGKEIIGEGVVAKNTKKTKKNNSNKKKKGRKVAAKSKSKDKGKSRKKARLESEDEESEDEESEDESEEDWEEYQSWKGDEKETKDKKSKIENVMSKFVIISYDLVNKYEDQLKGKNFQLIIADESHFLKSRDTKRTKSVLPLLLSARYVFLLSGTPAFSRPAELWTQLHALDHARFSAFHGFAQRYCNATMGTWGWDYTGSSNLSELNYLLMHTVLIRRLKKDVELELPNKTRQIIYIDISANAQRQVKKLMEKAEELELRIKNGEDDGGKNRFEKRRAMMEMIPAVKEYLSELYENSQKKFLVFSHHTEVMNAITEHMIEKHKAKYIRIDGSTDQRSRQGLCDRFQTEQDLRVAILSITAANVGLTLHAADLVVFAELFWNPSQLMQAEDRAHRIGRKGCVDVKYILAMSTLG